MAEGARVPALHLPLLSRLTYTDGERLLRFLPILYLAGTMTTTILAIGTRGDVQPFIALGRGLRARGHAVRLATHEHYEGWVRSHGLDYASLGTDPTAWLRSEEGRQWVSSGNNPLRFIRAFREALAPLMEQLFADCWAASRGSDLIIQSPLAAYYASSVGEREGIPVVPVHLAPFMRTRAFPAMLAPPAPLGGGYNLLTYALAEQALWQPFRATVNQCRATLLGLPPYPLLGPFRQNRRRGQPILCAFSPTVVPKPADWGEQVHVTGFWFLEEAADWQPPEALVAFLEGGAPPVYVGFGSMNNRDPEATTRLVVEALRQAGQRGVLYSGWGGLSSADLPDTVFKLESVPHEWLFPRVAAVVHHGGAGTTATGLRAGVPTVVVPFFGDQTFWGLRVAAVGAGPPPLPRNQLTAARLAEGIRRVTGDAATRERAAAVGRRLREEDGVGQAVAMLEQVR